MNHLGDYDVIVIGAGHAGIEAAHAAAVLGAKTAVFTMSLDAIGNMPCNPSIGGTAKGTLVREVDALGGVMGLAADATYLQSRMLNKGALPPKPAVPNRNICLPHSCCKNSSVSASALPLSVQKPTYRVSAASAAAAGAPK